MYLGLKMVKQDLVQLCLMFEGKNKLRRFIVPLFLSCETMLYPWVYHCRN